MITLDKWFRSTGDIDAARRHLCGVVRGHPNFIDGYKITTSNVLGKIPHPTRALILTEEGTIFSLLEPQETFARVWKDGIRDVKTRLMDSLEDVSSLLTTQRISKVFLNDKERFEGR